MLEGTLAIASGLLATGLAAGFVQRRCAQRGRGIGLSISGRAQAVLVALALGCPVVLLMLAKLFDSATLGWMFGLTLMLGIALLPCGALLAAGFCLGARLAGPALPTAHGMAPSAAVAGGDPAATFALRVVRDCVHASDDGDERRLMLDARMTLGELLRYARAGGYLPQIQGGAATWLVMSSAHGDRPIGVCAQQWPVDRLLVADVSLARHFGDVPAVIEFRYLAQQSPEVQLRRLQTAEGGDGSSRPAAGGGSAMVPSRR